jgi:putative hemolysin
MKKTLTFLFLAVILASCIQAPTSEPAGEKQSNTAASTCGDAPSSLIGNPAAFYCIDVMGYDYQIMPQSDGGQEGVCVMPDGEACNQWAFYAGQCGADFSYCAQNGWDIQTRADGEDPYANPYSICVDGENRTTRQLHEVIDFNTLPAAPETEAIRSTNTPVIPQAALDALPTSFDWRNVNGEDWNSPVKNQAGCSSCWAFAAVGAAEAYFNRFNNDPDLDLDLSEENLVSSCFYRGCDGGWSETALEYIRDVGIVDETCMPYTATDSECSTMCGSPQRYKVPIVVWEYYTLDVETLKYLVVNHGPVAVSMEYDGEFDTDDVYQCEPLEPYESNHAVVVVGYDDAGQYWIVKNSWGTFYKDNGYFKVGFNECNIDSKKYAILPNLGLNTYLPMSVNPGESFTTIPDVTGPEDGETLNTLIPTLTWQVDNSLDPSTWFKYTISEDPNLHKYSGGVRYFGNADEGTTTLAENLKENTTYYWHANYDYYDGSVWRDGPFTEAFTFTTGSGGTITAAPALLSPEDTASLTDTNVTLDWANVSGAVDYEITLYWWEEYEGNTYFMMIPLTSAESQLDVSGIVFPNTEYSWVVRARTSYAWGADSDVWTFTTGEETRSTSPDLSGIPIFVQDDQGEMIPAEIFFGEK